MDRLAMGHDPVAATTPGMPNFDDLFALEYPKLVRLASLFGADDPEEAAQEAFARLYLRIARFPGRGEALAYLRTIVCNLARSQARRRKVAMRTHPLARPMSNDPVNPADAASASNQTEQIINAIRALPIRQREAVVLCYWEHLTQPEAARVMGISVGSVKTHLHRAMASIRGRVSNR